MNQLNGNDAYWASRPMYRKAIVRMKAERTADRMKRAEKFDRAVHNALVARRLREILRKNDSEYAKRRIRIVPFSSLVSAVGDVTGYSWNELTSPRRQRALGKARQSLMYLAIHFTGMSLSEIGRRIGGRDHSTVHHARNAVEQHPENHSAVINAVCERFHLQVPAIEAEL